MMLITKIRSDGTNNSLHLLALNLAVKPLERIFCKNTFTGLTSQQGTEGAGVKCLHVWCDLMVNS